MYTDGSVYGKVVGYGARAAVLYHPSPIIEICYKSSSVGRMVSIEECEVDGIILGIDRVALFHETERNPTKPSNYYRQMCYKNVSNSNISEGPGGSRAAAVADGCRKVV